MRASRQAKRERGIWQRRYWEHQIRDEADLSRHVDYIHYNPVKHGWTARAAERLSLDITDISSESWQRQIGAAGNWKRRWTIVASVEMLGFLRQPNLRVLQEGC